MQFLEEIIEDLSHDLKSPSGVGGGGGNPIHMIY